ncbi:MAG: hypothetical protein ABW252_11010 [Polyangiales bacterium]
MARRVRYAERVGASVPFIGYDGMLPSTGFQLECADTLAAILRDPGRR